jgi:hypothetical protein
MCLLNILAVARRPLMRSGRPMHDTRVARELRRTKQTVDQ